jgi:hypothetical protein
LEVVSFDLIWQAGLPLMVTMWSASIQVRFPKKLVSLWPRVSVIARLPRHLNETKIKIILRPPPLMFWPSQTKGDPTRKYATRCCGKSSKSEDKT